MTSALTLLPIRVVLGMSALLFVCSAFSQELSTEFTPSTPAEAEGNSLLEIICIPTKDLPKHVSMVESIRTAPILVPIRKNPELFFDEKRIRPVAKFFGIGDKVELKLICTAGFALYQYKDAANELGVFAVLYVDEKSATEQFEEIVGAFNKQAKRSEPFPFVRKGRSLLLVWKDDAVRREAFEAVLEYLSAAEIQPMQ